MEPKFRVLGPLDVDGAGTLGGPKQRAMLARLLLDANTVVSHERLVDDLWPDDPPPGAARSLQVYASRIRSIVGRERVSFARGGYGLTLREGELDLARFHELTRESDRLLAEGQAHAARHPLGAALALWRGDPLSDVAPLLAPERAALAELRLAAHEQLIEVELASGRSAELVSELEALVRRHPLRERPRRQLMLALHRAGRSADALAVYRDLRSLLADDLGLEPREELRALERAILQNDPALAATATSRPRVRLPSPPTSLAGRRREIDELRGIVTGGGRIVTVTGPGGIGKTRLAIETARELTSSFPDGVVFVALDAVRDPQLVLAEVVAALELDDPRPPSVALDEYLRDRALLLVLDNFEHVEDAAPALSQLVGGAAGLHLLATSRDPLRVYGEREYPLAPLELEDAVPLFLERAAATGRRALSEDVAQEACARLDCLPLAIELAAARTRDLTPDELLAALAQRLELASGGPRDRPERQQTLRGAIGWSYDLLEQHEQAVFRNLAIFEHSWHDDSALAVCDANARALSSLATKSLIVAGDSRWQMLETVREYALERLRSAGEHDALKERHARHFLELADESKAVRRTPRELAHHDRLEGERANLHAARMHLLATDVRAAARLVDGLYRFWYGRGHYAEGAHAFAQVLERQSELAPRERGPLLMYAAAFAFARTDLARARVLAEDARRIFHAEREHEQLSRVLVLLGTVVSELGDHSAAIAALRESVDVARSLEDDLLLAFVVPHYHRALVFAGEFDTADEVGPEALALVRRVEFADEEASVLANLGLTALHRGAPASAAPLYADALRIAVERKLTPHVVSGLVGVAATAGAAGEHDAAARILAAADALAEARELPLESAERALRDRTANAAETALGATDYAAARDEGARLDLDSAARTADAVAARIAASATTRR